MGKYFLEVSNFDKGGLEKVVLDLSELMVESGDEITIVTSGTLGILAIEAKNKGIEVIQLKKPFAFLHYLFLLLRQKPDATVSHFTYFGNRASYLVGVPNITYLHNVYAFFSKRQDKSFRNADKYVNSYIAVSEICAEYAIHNFGLNPEKVKVVPNGIKSPPGHNPANKNKVRREDLGLSAQDFVFICPANLNLHKGFFLLLEALSIAREKDMSIKVISLGGVVFEPHLDLLKNAISNRGLDDAFLLLGHHSDIESYYAISDAAILTSFIEGWSIAVNEALANGLPLILSDTGSARELINNNDCGFLIPQPFGEVSNLNPILLNQLAYSDQTYSTSLSVAEAMLALSKNRTLAKSMGYCGQMKITSRYNEKVWLERTQTVFAEILNE